MVYDAILFDSGGVTGGVTVAGRFRGKPLLVVLVDEWWRSISLLLVVALAAAADGDSPREGERTRWRRLSCSLAESCSWRSTPCTESDDGWASGSKVVV